jgi:hypothetical protein
MALATVRANFVRALWITEYLVSCLVGCREVETLFRYLYIKRGLCPHEHGLAINELHRVIQIQPPIKPLARSFYSVVSFHLSVLRSFFLRVCDSHMH